MGTTESIPDRENGHRTRERRIRRQCRCNQSGDAFRYSNVRATASRSSAENNQWQSSRQKVYGRTRACGPSPIGVGIEGGHVHRSSEARYFAV